jgi:soluble lytic murein transglycosylase-like protein
VPQPFATLAATTALLMAAAAGYTITPGDSLSGVALEHGVTTRALAEANGLEDADRIVAGRTLTIPAGPAATSSRAGDATTHVVELGETLSHLAIRYGVRSVDLAVANDLDDHDRIREGQRLAIPGDGRTPPTAAPAAGTPPAGAASRADVGALIERVSREHGWNPAIVKAVAWQESGWSNGVVSGAGARGVMQIMPGTATFISEHLAGRTLDVADPADNVLAGVLFLDHLHDLTGGDVEHMLAGYYQGLASVRANGRYPSTEQYIRNVLALRERF